MELWIEKVLSKHVGETTEYSCEDDGKDGDPA